MEGARGERCEKIRRRSSFGRVRRVVVEDILGLEDIFD